MVVLTKRVAGAVSIISGVAVTLAGSFAGWALWGLMATYADDTPNTLLQNLSPLLLVIPALGGGAALVWAGQRLWRAPRPR